MTQNTELATTTTAILEAPGGNVLNAIAELKHGTVSIVSSIESNDWAARLAVVDALTNSVALEDHLNQPINLANFVVQAVEMKNERTGQPETAYRSVLISDDGIAFHAISKGVLSSLENLTAILGRPVLWPAPVTIHVLKEQAKIGRVMVVKLGAPKK